MRKVYVLYGWTPDDGEYVSGIYTSMRKAEHAKSLLEVVWHTKDHIYRIVTEILR